MSRTYSNIVMTTDGSSCDFCTKGKIGEIDNFIFVNYLFMDFDIVLVKCLGKHIQYINHKLGGVRVAHHFSFVFFLLYIFVLYLVSNVARVSGLSILNFAPKTFSNVDQCYVKLILAMLFMPFGYVVYALWLCCVSPLAMLFMPFGYVVYALWLCCVCPLAMLFMPFGYVVYALCIARNHG